MAVAPSMGKRLAAEFLGTFVLVFGGCGTAVLADRPTPDVGIGLLGVALAFGLTVLDDGVRRRPHLGRPLQPRRHARRWPPAAGSRWRDAAPTSPPRWSPAIAAGAVLLVIANGLDGFSAQASGFASNGYGDRSPGGLQPARRASSSRWC